MNVCCNQHAFLHPLLLLPACFDTCSATFWHVSDQNLPPPKDSSEFPEFRNPRESLEAGKLLQRRCCIHELQLSSKIRFALYKVGQARVSCLYRRSNGQNFVHKGSFCKFQHFWEDDELMLLVSNRFDPNTSYALAKVLWIIFQLLS
jgi:hypothetical protein